MPVIDFEITANRPDCLSVVGLAREAVGDLGPAAARCRTCTTRRAPGRAGRSRSTSTIEDAELCPRYCAQVVRRRTIGPSPPWMRERLEAAGVRPISNVVDVTNYVMLEIGQPMHAFDLERLAGRAHASCAARSAGETMRDARRRRADARPGHAGDRRRATAPQAIAGVMGGATPRSSGDTTTDRARERVLQAGVGAPDEQAARAEDRGVVALRARRRHRTPRRRASRARRRCSQQIGAGTAGRRA